MQEVSIDISFEPKKKASTRGQLLVRHDGEVIHSDVIDIAKDRDLTAFLNKLKNLCPAIDTENMRRLVLAEVASIATQRTEKQGKPADLDELRVVRPHLFYAPEVSGLLVPSIRLSGGTPQGRWLLYVQWAGGKRECRELEQSLTLSNNERIWFLPMPNDPRIDMASGWSAKGRQKWLEGYVPDTTDMFKSLSSMFNYYLDFPAEEASGHLATLSLWAILTYVYPVWPTVPYLWIGGPLGSGKSRVFDVLGRTVYRPLVSSNMTAPCLFRTIDAQGGTLLLDEAERLNERSAEAAEIRSILLSGYKTGGTAHRMEKRGDSFQPLAFNVYGPKAIAGINDLPAALTSRSICITMFKAAKNSPKPRRRIDKDPDKWATLSDDLHCFSLTNGQRFLEAAGEYISCEGISGRDMEVWQPIFALAKLIERAGATGLLVLTQQHARYLLDKSQQDMIPDLDEALLLALVEKLNNQLGGATASEVLSTAKDMEPAMFTYMTARGVGSVLKRYGICSSRIGGKRLFRPSQKQLLAIQESYGIYLVAGSADNEVRDLLEDALVP